MSLLIKICGLSTPETLDAALDAGADMVGLNFHPRSPRSVTLEQAAALARRARGRTRIVALVVDLPDSRLDAIRAAVVPDLWQLHGSEPPERIAAIRASQAIPVMKAIGVSQIAGLLRGELDMAGVIESGAAATRQYAKRQMTWFRNQMDDSWERLSTP